ncbi:MAG: aspartate aminotransferase family protein [Proteobacteria bacterium]|nr:aspartate aminotransferase family protein [Pseudomonadota bacterium]
MLGAAKDDPIVWDEALGANVKDADGNVFVDLVAGFGVALIGHRHPRVVEAVVAQQHRLLHAMGDASPDITRIRLLEALSERTPEGLDVALLGSSGSDAVDAAVKTAVLATGRSRVIAFDRAYHGLATGVLPLQAYKPAFTEPFASLLADRVSHVPWGCDREVLREVLAGGDVALVLAEPVQGRGGMHAPPDGWLAMVAEESRVAGALFALDEIQSGLGRTGEWWAGPALGVVPDLLCVGKALGGGFVLSACLGTPEVMAAWGASTGEALHTQTFLGHPVGCAAALATLEVLKDEDIPGTVARESAWIRAELESRGYPTRGRGLMLGIELGCDSLAASRALLQLGYITLPAGPTSLGLTPPAVVTRPQWLGFFDALDQVTP